MKKRQTMRTIKFRGKDIDTGEWLYGDLVRSKDGSMAAILVSDRDSYDECTVEYDTVGQFTGLYDKNGKEIYEGDIIISDEYKNAQHYVRYMESEAMFVAMIIGSSLDEYCGIRQWWIDKFSKKVIGNIHDNPELLKGE